MALPLVLFDTNLYLNLLLSPDPSGSAVGLAIEAASQGAYDLLLPADVVTELAYVKAQRPQVARRISQQQLESLLQRLHAFATTVPALKEEEVPPITRDPHDDFLLALKILYDVDFLVTRDKDLLTLGRIQRMRIVHPAAFLEMLRSPQS